MRTPYVEQIHIAILRKALFQSQTESACERVMMAALSANNIAEYLTSSFAIGEQHQVLGFPRDPTSRSGFEYFTPRDLGNLTQRAAAYYIANGLQVRKRGDRPLVVAIWAHGTIEWVATFFAIVRQLGGPE